MTRGEALIAGWMILIVLVVILVAIHHARNEGPPAP